jgi:hypothetical protein
MPSLNLTLSITFNGTVKLLADGLAVAEWAG